MSNPRTAVIGYGYAGRSFHSYLVGLTPGLTLHGISSRSAETRERIQKERGCKAYTSFEEVIADPDVDLVVLATPHDTHADLAVRALDAGKHVVTDKVMCLTLAECEQMIEAAERAGKLLSVFHNRRWDGDYLTVQKLMTEGELGNVRWIEMAWQNWGPPRNWRGTAAAGGGRFFDLGAHMMDQLLVLFPQPVQSVYCRMHHDFPNHDVESHVLIVVEFADGATGVIDASSMAAVSKPRFRVLGDQGTFVKYGVDPQEVAMRAGAIDGAYYDPATYGRLYDGTVERAIPTIPGRWRSYYENIADVLNQGAEPAVTLSEMRRLMTVLDAAQESAREGRVVTLTQ